MQKILQIASQRVGRVAVVAVMLGLLIVGGIAAPTMAQTETQVGNPFTDIYEQVSPSVVSISVVGRRPPSGINSPDETIVGGGTGFVYDREGHIVTNNHVVENATEIEISFVDGTLARADIIGLDPDSDLAVLKVDLPQDALADLQPVAFADSSQVQIGQTAIAIGSPFGQRWTLTTGIISAIDRSISGLTNFSIGGVIQTDAAINPGNSGGPLLDVNGHVIGVNSQIISSSRSNSGIGFAIPGNLAERNAQKLIDDGFVNYSYLGISGRDVYLPLIEAFDLPNDTQGVVVAEVAPGGPAARAGIEGAVFSEADGENLSRAVPESVDILMAIEGEPLSGISELIGYLAAETQPGDTVRVDVMRLTTAGEEELTVDVRLTPRP